MNAERHEELSGGELLVRRTPGLAEVMFNRPAVYNAFSPGMYDALGQLCQTLVDDSTTRVVILRGAGGKAFAAGNDINDFVSVRRGSQGVEYELRIRRILRRLFELPQVTIAAINGVCVGGGLAVATHCDVRLCTQGSHFGYPVSRTLGNALSASVVYRCVALFGEPLTREMLLTARLIDAERVHAVGAVMDVLNAEEFEESLQHVVDGVLRAAPGTLRATKQQLLAYAESHEGRPADDDERLARVYGSADFREGVRAFLAKEYPDFHREF